MISNAEVCKLRMRVGILEQGLEVSLPLASGTLMLNYI